MASYGPKPVVYFGLRGGGGFTEKDRIKGGVVRGIVGGYFGVGVLGGYFG